jgi:DNA-binding MurR/RpiR family transcriptional regulator
MKRINEAIAEKYSAMTKGQKILSEFVLEHCEKAAFMTSFELAAVSGVSQSTTVRFAVALGYSGYTEFQQALQSELKYRLSSLERFELMQDEPSENDLYDSITGTDAHNIKKTAALNDIEVLKSLCTRLSFASKVYIYGQGFCSAAAMYLYSYLKLILPNVCCVNLTGLEPIQSVAEIDSGDLLLAIGFPQYTMSTRRLVGYAHSREACVCTISESHESEIARHAEISMVSEYGDYGVNGSLAPVISLCGALICLLTKSDKRAQRRLKDAVLADSYMPEDEA